MAFDPILNSRLTLDFSPPIHIDTFRQNAILQACQLRDSFSNDNINDEYVPLSNSREVSVARGALSTDDEEDDLPTSSKAAAKSKKVNKEGWWFEESCKDKIKEHKAKHETVLSLLNRANSVEGESMSYYQRLNEKPESKIHDDCFNTIGTDTKLNLDLSIHQDGFLKFIESINGSVDNAISATVTVKSYAEQALSQTTKYLEALICGPPSRELHLETSKIAFKRFQLSTDCNLKSLYCKKLKYYHWQTYGIVNRSIDKKEKVPEDIRMTAIVFRPLIPKDYMRPKRIACRYRIMEKQFLVRGDNSLLSFRNKLLCQWDLLCVNKEDEICAAKTNGFFLQLIPSSFLFIHDTFYLDMTRDNAINLAKEYVEFMKTRKHIYGPTKIQDIANVKISDLTIRLGQPYVFVHMGGKCEHQFTFSDIRMLSYDDYYHLSTYPLKVYEYMRSKKCKVCKLAYPRVLVTKSDRMPQLPRLLCKQCFHNFHYVRTVKAGEFEAFDFIDKCVLK
uniref:snRNA-activating protein complex subunit 3 n=1 Tax=Rhabditophanes sp. KR3021 TaxID=114890 RepID=A0AC35TMG8_9BILA